MRKCNVAVNYDLTKVIKPEHDGKWIALNDENTEVIAVGDDPVEVHNEAIKKGAKEPMVIIGLKDYRNLIPTPFPVGLGKFELPI